MTAAEFLESRHWRRHSSGGGRRWSKCGWFCIQEHAVIIENVMERENGAVTPRDQMTPRELTRLVLHIKAGRDLETTPGQAAFDEVHRLLDAWNQRNGRTVKPQRNVAERSALESEEVPA